MTRKQIVLLVGPDPDGIGGIETVLRTYMNSSPKNLEMKLLVTWNLTVAGARSKFPAIRAAIRFLRDASALRKQDAAVHVHLSQKGSFMREGLFVFLARAVGLGTFATVHGSSFVTSSASPALRILYRLVLRACNSVAVLNQSTSDAVAGLGVRNVVLLPNPGPVPSHQLPALPSKNKPIATFAGAVGKRKGVDTLVAAWELVTHAVPNACLVLIGPCEDVELASAVKQFWKGPATPAEVLEALTVSRVAVLPSTAEAMPMFVLEAMGVGLPTVVTDVGAMASQVAGSGQVITPGDVQALADALIRYLSEPEYADEHGQRALDRYRKQFSTESFESGLLRFYCFDLNASV